MDRSHFVVIAGPDKDKLLPVLPGVNTLGRGADAGYRVNDARVSRAHCSIAADGPTVTVADTGGSGGVLVNGAAVTAHTLRPGDVIRVGESTLRYQTAPAADATLPTLAAAAEYDPKATDQLAELSGRTLAHYAIGPVLGKGTSGMVFRATDSATGRPVALKIMQPAFAKNEDDMHRFVRAMKAMLPLKHPNLVAVYAAGKSGPYCWAAMELVEGEALTAVIKRIGVANMLDWKYAYRVAVHIARALAYAHGQGIVHRDIAPANILVRAADKAVILADLMLAKALEGANAQQITKPGELVGDVNYMPPERAGADPAAVDHRSDLFGLGATCYALLSGKPPFQGANLIETVVNIHSAQPLPLTGVQMGIPTSFEGAVLKLLAKSPDDRYQSAAELLSDLERIGKSNGATA